MAGELSISWPTFTSCLSTWGTKSAWSQDAAVVVGPGLLSRRWQDNAHTFALNAGPHALAAAARLPGCLAALCICGLAPYPADGLDFFAGLGEDSEFAFIRGAFIAKGAVVEHPADRPGPRRRRVQGRFGKRGGCHQVLQRAAPRDLFADPAFIIEQLSSLLPEVDRKAILENPNVGQELVGSMAEALRSGVDGWVDDDLAFAKPWGFELSEIRVPVLLYQGDEDMMVPLAHGKWFNEHLPQDKVRSHLMNGEGHFSIAHRHFDAMLAEILVAARR